VCVCVCVCVVWVRESERICARVCGFETEKESKINEVRER